MPHSELELLPRGKIGVRSNVAGDGGNIDQGIDGEDRDAINTAQIGRVEASERGSDDHNPAILRYGFDDALKDSNRLRRVWGKVR